MRDEDALSFFLLFERVMQLLAIRPKAAAVSWTVIGQPGIAFRQLYPLTNNFYGTFLPSLNLNFTLFNNDPNNIRYSP